MLRSVSAKGQRPGPPIGVVLAGGAGRRLGGSKACVQLAGRPLICWPLAVLQAALADVAVVAKRDTPLPPLPCGVQVWHEPDEPRHPLTGILEALRRAQPRAVLVCAVDMPLLDAAAVRLLVGAAAGPGGVALATADGRLQPLLGRYEAVAFAALAAAAEADPRSPLTRTVLALEPTRVQLPAQALHNVNDRHDLEEAQLALAHGKESLSPGG